MLTAKLTIEVDGPLVDNYKELVQGTASVFGLEADSVLPWAGGVVFTLSALDDDETAFRTNCARVVEQLRTGSLALPATPRSSKRRKVSRRSAKPHTTQLTVFVSYTYDSEAHIAWVEYLSHRLKGAGFLVRLDRWSVPPGHELTAFMDGIQDCDRVLIVCTPNYKLKSDGRAGGAGYEGSVITGQLFAGAAPEGKFIPLLRSGQWKDAGPARLLSARYVDLRPEVDETKAMRELMEALTGHPHSAVASQPRRDGRARQSAGDATRARLAQVLAHVASPGASVAKGIAEALSALPSSGFRALRSFCERELNGIRGGTLDKRDEDFPSHRVYEMFVSYGAHINPSFFGFSGKAESALAFMAANPKDFPRLRTAMTDPITQIESRAREAKSSDTHLRAWNLRAADVVPDTPAPDVPVFCYARTTVDRGIVEATRGEFIRLLTEGLRSVGSKPKR